MTPLVWSIELHDRVLTHRSLPGDRGQAHHPLATEHVCSRKSGPVPAFGIIGPDLGGQLAHLLIRERRLDRFTLNRLAPW